MLVIVLSGATTPDPTLGFVVQIAVATRGRVVGRAHCAVEWLVPWRNPVPPEAAIGPCY